MWAAGDAFLYIFRRLSLYWSRPHLLIWITSKFEAFYTAYSKFLLGLSLSAPRLSECALPWRKSCGREPDESLYVSADVVCLLFLWEWESAGWWPDFDRAKRFASYALLIEGLTLVITVALVIHHAWSGPK